MNKKAIIMLSGGLDSLLAVKIMLNQGIELVGLNFTSIFCTCTSHKRKKSGCSSEAIRAVRELNIPLKTLLKGMDYFKIVEFPKFGYGKGVNPCLDCRIYILKKAKELLKKYNASFIVTGEVLGQRPMSQMKHHFKLIEKETKLEGLIVRPLCAKFLEPTIPEKVGIIDRNELLAISGRSRKEQIKLANDLNITDYPCPSGGCLLTDKIFSKRIKDLFLYKKDYDIIDLKLLKLGRHFRINETCKIIVGRNEAENLELTNLALLKKKYNLFTPMNFSGPTIYIDSITGDNILNFVTELFIRYSKIENSYEENKIKYKTENKECIIELKNIEKIMHFEALLI